MKRLTVCTGWSAAGWKLYGQAFADTFAKYWPEDVDLVVYGEEPCALKRGEFRSLFDIPEARATLQRYDNPVHRGHVPAPGWKERAVKLGYNWRFDAWKFCRQGLIPLHAATHLEPGELLCWLDGDVQTRAPVPPGFIQGLLPPGADLAYLGREPKHSEIGFQLYRAGRATAMLAEFFSLYVTGSIVREKEWHSAYAFDIARRMSGIKAHNLTPRGSGNVWDTSVLAPYTVHYKGDRKIDAQRAFYAGGQR